MKKSTKSLVWDIVKAAAAAIIGVVSAYLTGCTTINFPADDTRPTSFNGITSASIKVTVEAGEAPVPPPPPIAESEDGITKVMTLVDAVTGADRVITGMNDFVLDGEGLELAEDGGDGVTGVKFSGPGLEDYLDLTGGRAQRRLEAHRLRRQLRRHARAGRPRMPPRPLPEARRSDGPQRLDRLHPAQGVR